MVKVSQRGEDVENKNISDIIEAYLKQVLDDEEMVEIRRSEMAHQFNCVPSQINYVIKTRFTVPKGYAVESKRGGGGYIRIVKVHVSDDQSLLEHLRSRVGEALSESDALAILQHLYDNQLLTKHEGDLLLAAMDHRVFEGLTQVENIIRARMVQSLLDRLRYEEKE